MGSEQKKHLMFHQLLARIKDVMSYEFVMLLFLDEEFRQLQQNFMEKHYLEFEDSEENKLSYTTIFNEYVSHRRADFQNSVF